MDFCVLVLWLHRFHKEFYVPDTESQKSALCCVVSKFSSKVAKRKKFSSWRGYPDSLLVMWSLRRCWHLVPHTAFCGVSRPSFKRWKKRTHECHLLSLVSWYWNFCFWYTFVSQSRQVLGFDFHYDYLLFLLSWLLTFLRDSNVYFMGSSLPRGFLLHTAGLSLYLKKNENCRSPHGGFAENHLAHLEQRLDSLVFVVVLFLIHCNKKNPTKHYCATSEVNTF